ncbi:MAG: hypothetical protein VB102_10385 [Paludibacter sp.]|nr:hypothetical protein [Paludibacter sp.]
MKQFFKINFFWVILATIFMSSCETSEVTNINFDKAAISLKVGQTDSISSTIAYTGEISNMPHEWIVENPAIISITEKDPATSNGATSGSSLEKVVVIKALKAGSSKVTLSVDGKKLSCQVTVDQRVFTFNQAQASNWGNLYGSGNNNFTLSLLENSLSLDEEGYVVGEGNRIFIDFYLPLTQNTISSGVINISSGEENYTFYPGNIIEDQGESFPIGTLLINYNSNNATIMLIKDGTFTITRNEDNFIIEGEFTLETNEIIQFRYEGKISVEDNREFNPNLTKGMLKYFGDFYESKTTNNFIIYMGSESVNFNDENWIGDILMIELNTPDSVHDYIPEGTYEMVPVVENYESLVQSLKPLSLVFGFTLDDINLGTWFYGKITKALSEGSMTVTKSGDIYTIQYELFDGFGSKVWGTYNGPLTYIDATQNSSNVGPSYVKRNKTKNIQVKKVLIKKDRLKVRKPVKY